MRSIAAVVLTLALLVAACAAPREDGAAEDAGANPPAAGAPTVDPTQAGDGEGTADPEGPGGGQEAGEQEAGEPTIVVAAVDRAAPAPDAPVDDAVRGLLALTGGLQGVIAPEPANTVFSPLSIALAFGMARAGAAGRTAEEIDEVLGFPPGVHAAFNVLEQALVTADAPPTTTEPEEPRDASQPPGPPVLSLANALYAQEGLHLEDPFLETLAADYGAGMATVDFADSDATKRLIDAWVREQTAGRIEELFREVRPDWVLVLANAVYLKADWEHPFVEGVHDEPFTLASGAEVAVPTMRRVGRMPYAAGAGWQAVELPYASGDLAMTVLVPDEPGAEAGALLDPGVLGTARAGLAEAVVDLKLPQWDVDTDVDLVAALRALGLRAPFSGADFSGMTGGPGLFISEALHRATITVDEWGTEAAAVTGLGMAFSGPPEPEATVHADRPFAFVIVHTPTGAPLFAGTVADPSG